MKAFVAFALAASAAHLAHAADDTAPAGAAASASAPAVAPSSPAHKAKYEVKPEDAGFCLYHGRPSGDAKYTPGKAIETSRETYGSVLDELPRFVSTAKAAGAEAVIDYSGAQHFGLLPWRLVRPLVHGTAIHWDGPAPDCAASGGATFATVMATDKEPPKH